MNADDPYGILQSSRQTSSWSDWTAMSGSFTQFFGLSSLFATLFSRNSYLFDSAKLLILGSIIETGRRLCQWLIERFRFRYAYYITDTAEYSMTAQFDEGDPAYEWIVHFLTQEKVWRRSREFRVSAKNSKRKWGVKTGSDIHTEGNADYVPTYELPQLFRWRRYWLEIKRSKGMQTVSQFGSHSTATIYVTIYTLDMTVLSALVEDARLRYIEVSRPDVIIHMADSPHRGPGFAWNNVKRKTRRPLSSIILQEGVIDSLVQDIQEFIDTEDWYIEAGIPHRRGYLLYGPPGTGKSSTIYALAGELGLEIYSLSLASGFVDDSFLEYAASAIPKQSILLIEDIDCAFPSREDEEDEQLSMMPGYPGIMPTPFMHKSAVTLSGLLNVIDGVGSEEGKLFFATTNYIDRLDPALLRPGRIDKKVQYSLATKEQASALFTRFFPESRFGSLIDKCTNNSDDRNTIPHDHEKPSSKLLELAEAFAAGVPQHEFSTAELQGYLLSCKKTPESAATGIDVWVEQERAERQERQVREEKRKQKLRETKERREANQLQGPLARLGGMYLPNPGAPFRDATVMSVPTPLSPSEGLGQPSTVKEESDDLPGSIAPLNVMVNGKPDGDSASDCSLNSLASS